MHPLIKSQERRVKFLEKKYERLGAAYINALSGSSEEEQALSNLNEYFGRKEEAHLTLNRLKKAARK